MDKTKRTPPSKTPGATKRHLKRRAWVSAEVARIRQEAAEQERVSAEAREP
jgi:hypothetical protein